MTVKLSIAEHNRKRMNSVGREWRLRGREKGWPIRQGRNKDITHTEMEGREGN